MLENFVAKLNQEKHTRERLEEIRGIGKKLFDSPHQIEDFAEETGITLTDPQPSPDGQRTPFINYYDIDVALRAPDTGTKFQVIVLPKERAPERTYPIYATAYGTRLELAIGKSATQEAREAAEEQVVDIFQAFARCFGVDK